MGTFGSCCLSLMWELGRAQFTTPKLRTVPGSHSAVALLSTCRSCVISSRMEGSTRTGKGQMDPWHLSSKNYSVFCSVKWSLKSGSGNTKNSVTMIPLKGEAEFTFSRFLLIFSWAVLCGYCRESYAGCMGKSSYKENGNRERFSLKQRNIHFFRF